MFVLGEKRDLRVDFFRGLALWWIFCDHIPGDVLGDYSLRNFALCDASEVFVLLAGFSAGSAYGSKMDRDGYGYAAVSVLHRAWTLFVAHVFLFVVYAAQVGYSANILGRFSYLDESHLDVLAGAPYRALLDALFLLYQPSLLNILPLYVVLLLIFAVALPLLRRPKCLLMLSMSLYFTVRAAGINLPSSLGGGWFFNPLAWQLLFVIGAMLAYAPVKMPEPRSLFDVVAVLILLIGLAIIWIFWKHPSVLSILPESVARGVLWIDKTTLDPLRLISVLSLLWLTVRLVPRGADWLRSRWSAPLVLMGQHSLPVFCVGIVIGFGGRLALELNNGALIQLLVNVIGASSLVTVGALAAWSGDCLRRRRARDTTSQPDSNSKDMKISHAHALGHPVLDRQSAHSRALPLNDRTTIQEPCDGLCWGKLSLDRLHALPPGVGAHAAEGGATYRVRLAAGLLQCSRSPRLVCSTFLTTHVLSSNGLQVLRR